MKFLCTILATILLIGTAIACPACEKIPQGKFLSGEQHSDCSYESGFTRTTFPAHVSEAQNIIDYYWVKFAHEFGVKANPSAPFVGLIVDSKTNQLLCMNVNERAFGKGYSAHGEIQAIANCSMSVLRDSTVNGKIVPHARWSDVTLYGNIETCPMCAFHSFYRGIKRMVFGARASELTRQRCWDQATITVQELADHNSKVNMTYLRGPLPDYESTILQGFPSRC